ncbi:MAG: hypothetical protein ACWA6Y_02570 [Polaromonas sp.]
MSMPTGAPVRGLMACQPAGGSSSPARALASPSRRLTLSTRHWHPQPHGG